MANIIPAILESDINKLQAKLEALADLVEYAQIDIMDGQFVDNTSVGPEELAQIQTGLKLEAHLMVMEPRAWLQYLNPDIFKRVYFHIEAVPEPESLISEIKEAGFEVGLAINAETPASVLESLAEYVDAVLFMSVTPGRQGQAFIPDVLAKLKAFSLQYPDPDTAIDGGINEDNILQVADTGVTNICIGSAIFKDGDIAGNILKLQKQLI